MPSKLTQGTRTPGFLPVVLKPGVDSIPGSMHLRVDHDTSLPIFRPQGQPLVGCGWSMGVVSTLVRTDPLLGVCVWRWGRKGSRWGLPSGGQLSWYCYILVQNSKESKNAKFETSFPCYYEVIFVKMGEQNILSSTLLAWLTLSEYLVSCSGGFHLCSCPGLGDIRSGRMLPPPTPAGPGASSFPFGWIQDFTAK